MDTKITSLYRDRKVSMPNLGIYFSDEEVSYIREQEKGFVRALVIQRMEAGDEFVSKPTTRKAQIAAENENRKTSDFSPGRNCRSCGAMLPFHGAKVCKLCKAKQ